MARKPTHANTEPATHKSIAADLADFRKRGGKIEKLGDTPLRSVATSPFRSNPAERKAPTPVSRAASR